MDDLCKNVQKGKCVCGNLKCEYVVFELVWDEWTDSWELPDKITGYIGDGFLDGTLMNISNYEKGGKGFMIYDNETYGTNGVELKEGDYLVKVLNNNVSYLIGKFTKEEFYNIFTVTE